MKPPWGSKITISVYYDHELDSDQLDKLMDDLNRLRFKKAQFIGMQYETVDKEPNDQIAS